MDIAAHRIELIVLDFYNHGVEGIIYEIKNRFCGQALSHQTCDIVNYEDSHPLNSTKTTAEKTREFFQISENGSVYVDRKVKPDSELESLVKSLTEENRKLKAKLTKINGVVNE